MKSLLNIEGKLDDMQLVKLDDGSILKIVVLSVVLNSIATAIIVAILR